MNFDFATAQRIVFGPEKLAEIGKLAAPFGRRALVVAGRDTARAAPLIKKLQEHDIVCQTFSVAGEPSADTAQIGARAAQGCDLVIAIGGGSVIDAGKAIAALCTNPGDVFDYLEVVGRGQPLTNAPLPFIAVPTTAGTGAEVTRNAVLCSPQHGVKVSLRSPLMLPTIALIDPQLAHNLPPDITANTGMDALTQLIEPFVSCRANVFTDALCRDGIARAARALRRACANDAEARCEMALCSLFGGLALANAGLGAVHGFAAPLGGSFRAPHGAVCAALLPHVMETNWHSLQARAPQNPAHARYDEVAQLLMGNPDATARDGIEWVRQLCRDLNISGLSAHGISATDLDEIASKAATASSMQANPLPLTHEELRATLAAAL